MTQTVDTVDIQKIADLVNRMYLPSGLGDKENACSIAAINLALTGELTDEVPECMSEVIGRWIIVTQDAMPDSMRNSPEWKRLLPLAAGTGRAHEKERLNVLLNHMWTVVLPLLQPVADAQGFGDEWRTMTTEKTASGAEVAAEAAEAAAPGAAVAMSAALAAAAAAEGSAVRAECTAVVVGSAAAAVAMSAAAAAWETLNPCQLLADLIAVGEYGVHTPYSPPN